MKQLLFVLFTLLGGMPTMAQKDFEGKIVYQLEASMDEKRPALTVHFAPGKLKIMFREGLDPDDTYLLVWLDSAKIISVNSSSQTYKPRNMNVKDNTPFTPEKKTIAGHATTSAKSETSQPGGTLGLVSMQDMLLNVADDLTFTVPDNLISNPELLMVRNNHVVLGASINMGMAFGVMDNEEAKKKITATAISVTPMTFGADEFAIPAGFSLKAKDVYDYDETKIAVDSAAVAYDTVVTVVDSAIAVPAKKTTKKPTKRPANKRTVVKSAANRKQ